MELDDRNDVGTRGGGRTSRWAIRILWIFVERLISKMPLEAGALTIREQPISAGHEVSTWLSADRMRSKYRIFERGAGETLSSGTGSCACGGGRGRQGTVTSPVKVVAPGGPQAVRWENKVYLSPVISPSGHSRLPWKYLTVTLSREDRSDDRSTEKCESNRPRCVRGDKVGIVAPAVERQARRLLEAGCDALRSLGYEPFYIRTRSWSVIFILRARVERRVRELEEMFAAG